MPMIKANDEITIESDNIGRIKTQGNIRIEIDNAWKDGPELKIEVLNDAVNEMS